MLAQVGCTLFFEMPCIGFFFLPLDTQWISAMYPNKKYQKYLCNNTLLLGNTLRAGCSWKKGCLVQEWPAPGALPYTKMAKSQTKVHDEDETYSKLLHKIKLFLLRHSFKDVQQSSPLGSSFPDSWSKVSLPIWDSDRQPTMELALHPVSCWFAIG